jgi:hypothetical protein
MLSSLLDLSTSAASAPCVSAGATPLTAMATENGLGCPLGNPFTTRGTQQTFQHGQMLWREDTGQIYVFMADGWASHADELRVGEPEPESLALPDPDLRQPRLGFGRVWRDLGGPSAPIGWATVGERTFQLTVQSFENGTMLRTGLTRPGDVEPILYAVHANGEWASTVPTAMLAPIPPFRFGMFEDFNFSPDPTRVKAIVQDLRRRGFDSIMWTNGSVDRQNAALDVSDRLGIDMMLGPATELNMRWWWDTSAPETIEEARDRLYPLIDQLRTHSSLRGYSIVDEPSRSLSRKVVLAVQAFRERDPYRPSFPVLIGLDRVGPIFDAAGPGALVIDVYPVAVANPPCDFSMTGFGYQGLDFISYVREATKKKPPEVPLWMILQTHGLPGAGLREPSVEEVRKQFWLAVGEGAQGVFWFIYSSQQGWTGLEDNPGLYAEVTTLARRVDVLRTWLAGTWKVPDRFVATNGAYASTLTGRDGSRTYVVVANPDCGPRDTSIRSQTGDVGALRDVESGRVYGPGETVTLQGGDGRLFRLERSPP